MEKTGALNKFLDNEVKTASKRFILAVADHMRKESAPGHISEMTEDFKRLFRLCRETGREVRFVQITLVRSKALMREPFYLLEAFDREFHLSEPIASVELDLKWLYREYYRFCREIEEQSKKYVLCFTDIELDYIKQVELVSCRRAVRHLFEEALVFILNAEEYLALEAEPGFQILQGEYRGPCEKIFETDQFTEKIGKLWYGIL